ncbi:MAG: lamin tail domain-containing protein, partial [Halobacteriota archaeon]|nr:lamin tail domain-containing protein [Halobacteriota archaeon]
MNEIRKAGIALILLLIFLVAPVTTASEDHLLIKEFYADTLVKNDLDEYIAIHNPGSRPVDISDWTLSDQEANITFPEGTVIEREELIYLTRDALIFEQNNGKKA